MPCFVLDHRQLFISHQSDGLPETFTPLNISTQQTPSSDFNPSPTTDLTSRSATIAFSSTPRMDDQVSFAPAPSGQESVGDLMVHMALPKHPQMGTMISESSSSTSTASASPLTSSSQQKKKKKRSTRYRTPEETLEVAMMCSNKTWAAAEGATVAVIRQRITNAVTTVASREGLTSESILRGLDRQRFDTGLIGSPEFYRLSRLDSRVGDDIQAKAKVRSPNEWLQLEMCSRADMRKLTLVLRLSADRRAAEEIHRVDEARQLDERRRAEIERKAEESRRAEERRRAEKQQKAEEKRQAEYHHRAEKQQREVDREERRQAEEQRREADLEEHRRAAELRVAERFRLAEEQRAEQEQQQAEQQAEQRERIETLKALLSNGDAGDILQCVATNTYKDLAAASPNGGTRVRTMIFNAIRGVALAQNRSEQDVAAEVDNRRLANGIKMDSGSGGAGSLSAKARSRAKRNAFKAKYRAYELRQSQLSATTTISASQSIVMVDGDEESSAPDNRVPPKSIIDTSMESSSSSSPDLQQLRTEEWVLQSSV